MCYKRLSSLVLNILLLFFFCACSDNDSTVNNPQTNTIDGIQAAQADHRWSVISGVPEPEFGITQQAPATPSNWNSGLPGFYYIENSHPDASDIHNDYGHPDKPRRSIPETLPPGSVVEIHGKVAERVILNASGSADEPIFIRGASYAERPTFSNIVRVSGAYIILENIKTQPLPETDSGNAGLRIIEGAHHIGVRNVEISGTDNLHKTGGLGIGSWGYNGTDIAHAIVLNRLHIHDIGDLSTTLDQDAHGITINGNAENVWVINSTINGTSGDGVQIEAQAYRGRDRIHHIYLANNRIWNNKQTGLWVKHARDVVIAHNEIYAMQRSPSSPGACAGYQYAGDQLWFINNTLHDCYQGIIAQSGSSGQQTAVYYIGNLIYNIHSDQPANPHGAGAFTLRMNNARHYVINNTVFNVDAAINAPIQSSAELHIYNNIFSGRTEADNHDIYLESVSSNTFADNNIIYHSDAISLRWGNTYHDFDELYAEHGECANCYSVDPLFVSHDHGDFRLQTHSPAINSGIAHSAFNHFSDRYGFELDSDLSNHSRSSSQIDIGALEFSDNED